MVRISSAAAGVTFCGRMWMLVGLLFASYCEPLTAFSLTSHSSMGWWRRDQFGSPEYMPAAFKKRRGENLYECQTEGVQTPETPRAIGARYAAAPAFDKTPHLSSFPSHPLSSPHIYIFFVPVLVDNEGPPCISCVVFFRSLGVLNGML